LYSFDKERYEELQKMKYMDLVRRGLDFEIWWSFILSKG
jgi:hypothetical protein